MEQKVIWLAYLAMIPFVMAEIAGFREEPAKFKLNFF